MSDRTELPAFVGIDSAIYTTTKIEHGVKFFQDWGLDLVTRADGFAELKTEQGSRIVLTDGDARAPGGVGPRTRSEGYRGVIWGLRSASDIDKVGARLKGRSGLRRGDDDTLFAVDPFGYDIGFRVWRFAPLPPARMLVNNPGLKLRISSPALAYASAKPSRIGHVVFEVAGPSDLKHAEEFYTDCLGFNLSDRYVGQAAFLRCAVEQDHHNLALLDTKGGENVFQHVAFEMRDIHEVFSGGLKFSELGGETAIGPGRHKFSSAYFWYFKNPIGGQVEYFADMDFLDASWEPREPLPDPSTIAEWALPRGARRFKSMKDLSESN
jgi:hypothetical protein